MVNFTVYQPLSGHDEDSPPIADGKMLVVCDGLGGGGQNSYVIDGEKRTSAYLGSRQVSLAFRSFFDEYKNPDVSLTNDEIILSLKAHIQKHLDDYVAKNRLKNVVKGKSMQMLPTTLAAVLYREGRDSTDALVISAGDSRAFVLTARDGLRQISKDDVFEDVDAYEKTATMTNNIRQDGDFALSYRLYSLPKDCVLFVSSDGCFDYISTPMEFERFIEFALNASSKFGKEAFNPEKNLIGRLLGKMLCQRGLQDDCTMAGAIIGYDDTERFFSSFSERYALINKKYKEPFTKLDKELAAKKHDSQARLPGIEKLIDDYSEKIDTLSRNFVLNTFRSEICASGATQNPAVLQAEKILSDIPLFRSYVDSLIDSENEKSDKIFRLQNELADIENDLYGLYCDRRFEDFMLAIERDVVSLDHLLPDKRCLIDEFLDITTHLNDDLYEYSAAINSFNDVFSSFSENCFNPSAQFDIGQLRSRFEYILGLYGRCRQNIMRADELKMMIKNVYMTDFDVEGDFSIAMQSSFSEYTNVESFSPVIEKYGSYTQLRNELTALPDPMSEAGLIGAFECFLDENIADFKNLIINDSSLCEVIFGDVYAEYEELIKERDSLKKSVDEIEAKKTSLWLLYKLDYELFNKCVREGRV